MSFMRFSAAPAGRLDDRTIPWAIFGERPEVADGLEDSALAGANLAQIASTPGAPMFDPDSLFGAHMAGRPLDLAGDGPVVVFVHGFQHEPRRPVTARARSDNAHRTIYHFDETPAGPGSAEERRLRTTPWFARAMLPGGTGGSDDCKGVAVGFCYASWGGSREPFLPGRAGRLRARLAASWVPSWPRREPPAPYVEAYRDAETAGFGLAALLTQLRVRLDDAGLAAKPLDIFCHSLGVRAVMSALAMLAQRWPADPTLARIGRVVMAGGACYWGEAAYALANIGFADPTRRPEFYNVLSRRDDVLRFLATRATPARALAQAAEDLSLDRAGQRLLKRGRTVGLHGRPPHVLYAEFGAAYADWTDIPLDAPHVWRWGRKQGFRLRGGSPLSLGDHWVHVTRPQNWALYRAILHRRDGFGARDVDAALAGRG